MADRNTTSSRARRLPRAGMPSARGKAYQERREIPAVPSGNELEGVIFGQSLLLDVHASRASSTVMLEGTCVAVVGPGQSGAPSRCVYRRLEVSSRL